MDKRYRFTFAFVLCAFLTFSCHGNQTMKKYEWYPTESAKAEYPMYVIGGDIYYEGGKIYIPDERIADNGWGELGASHIVGDAEKGIPKKLELSYFSFLENKFYSGAVTLPTETFDYLFEQGVTNQATGNRGDYSAVIIGMGLGGEIAIWMNGFGVVTEVGQFTLPAVDMPWESVLDDEEISRKEFISIILEEAFSNEEALEKSKVRAKTTDFWHRYKDKHPIKLSFEGTVKPLSYFFRTLNGEREYQPTAITTEKETKLRGMPSQMILNFQSGNGTVFNLTMQFDEDTIVRAFEELSSQLPDAHYTLIIDVEDATKHAAAYIKTEKLRLPLPNTTFSITKYK